MNITQALHTFESAATPGEAPALLEACAQFAKIGWRPEQITELIEAITESRIVAFGFGQTHIIGTTDRSKL